MSNSSPLADGPETVREIRRVRHETRRRLLTVTEISDITPRMRRVRFSSPEMSDFVSLGFDDHIKIMIPQRDGEMLMRDYTPRAFDLDGGEFVIDFALHDGAGPVTAWAIAASEGDTLAIGGPRGSAIVPQDFDWHLLVGDETALPAIGRRVEELAPGSRAITIAAVGSVEEQQTFSANADVQSHWVIRDRDGHDDAATLVAAIDARIPRQGEGFIWMAGEAELARALKAHVLNTIGHNPKHLKAAGYWVRGGAGKHQPIE